MGLQPDQADAIRSKAVEVDPMIFMPPQIREALASIGVGPSGGGAVSSTCPAGLDGTIGTSSNATPAATGDALEAYEERKIDPDIQELCDKFFIEERHCKRLDEVMRSRPDTFAADLEKLQCKFERARNPNALLVSKMREMVEGTFVGMIAPCAVQNAMARKYKLDAPAVSKLADILGRCDEPKKQQYLEDLDRHLAAAARPSALVMMMLKKISEGAPLGKPSAAQPGSYADLQRDKEDRSRRGRSRSRERGRSRDRDRGRRE